MEKKNKYRIKLFDLFKIISGGILFSLWGHYSKNGFSEAFNYNKLGEDFLYGCLMITLVLILDWKIKQRKA